MRTASLKFRFASWLAIAAMALNALWPLLANAKPSGAQSLMEICTSQGVKSVAGDSDSAPGNSAAKHLQPHCALCSFGTDKVSAPPPAPLFLASAAVSGEVVHFTSSSAEPRSDIPTPAHPRAPPALS